MGKAAFAVHDVDVKHMGSGKATMVGISGAIDREGRKLGTTLQQTLRGFLQAFTRVAVPASDQSAVEIQKAFAAALKNPKPLDVPCVWIQLGMLGIDVLQVFRNPKEFTSFQTFYDGTNVELSAEQQATLTLFARIANPR